MLTASCVSCSAQAPSAARDSPVLLASVNTAGGAVEKVALVYRDTAGCDDCAEAVASVLRHSPHAFSVYYVGPGEAQDLRDDVFGKATLYAQPGGLGTVDAEFARLAPHAEQIRRFVAGGGRYIGFCMGGYLAGKSPGFDLLPGDSDSYIQSPGASVRDERDTLVDVVWRGKTRSVYFQDGPFFTVPPASQAAPAAVSLASYSSNGTVAALVAPYGRGRVAVVGFHPEAPAAWYSEKGLSDNKGLAADIAADLIDALMR